MADTKKTTDKLLLEIAELKKQLAVQKKARKKAETSARAKSDFLASMSHEIRTPLNAILGITDLILGDFEVNNVRTNIERIKDASLCLYEIINDILDYSKIEAQTLESEESDFSPHVLLQQVLALHSFQAERKGLSLELKISDDLPDTLHGDAFGLRQILQNLLANAIKFTERGGVSISAHLSEKSNDPGVGKEHVVLSVRITDTGIGIAEEHLCRIWSSFSQADESISRRFGGTGLGLAICKHLAGQMNGELSVESQPGSGSSFVAELPFTITASSADSVAPFAPARSMLQGLTPSHLRTPQLSPLRILVVEDNALNRDLLSIFFKGRKHSVTCADDGVQAIEILKKKTFDIILMDIQMPEMDGLGCTQYIRNSDDLACASDIPIIALTAHAIKGDRARFMRKGMDEYVPKPVDFSQLVDIMRKLLPHKVLNASKDGYNAERPQEECLCGPASDAAMLSPQEHHEMAQDRQEALGLIGGACELLARLDSVFLASAPEDMKELERAMNAEQLKEAARLAHKIKGGAATIGMKALAASALELEKACLARKNDRHALLDTVSANMRSAMEFLAPTADTNSIQ